LSSRPRVAEYCFRDRLDGIYEISGVDIFLSKDPVSFPRMFTVYFVDDYRRDSDIGVYTMHFS